VIVVSDTSPINYLILIGRVDLLPSLYGTVAIPEAVHRELKRGVSPERVRSWALNLPEWVQVHQVLEGEVDTDLDVGEAEAIALAHALRADLLLIDDRKGRLIATEQELEVTGVLGVLLDAAERGLLDLPVAVNDLLKTTFRAKPQLLQTLLERARQLQHEREERAGAAAVEQPEKESSTTASQETPQEPEQSQEIDLEL
jgi:predicted nucleic acid-binding protein